MQRAAAVICLTLLAPACAAEGEEMGEEGWRDDLCGMSFHYDGREDGAEVTGTPNGAVDAVLYAPGMSGYEGNGSSLWMKVDLRWQADPTQDEPNPKSQRRDSQINVTCGSNEITSDLKDEDENGHRASVGEYTIHFAADVVWGTWSLDSGANGEFRSPASDQEPPMKPDVYNPIDDNPFD